MQDEYDMGHGVDRGTLRAYLSGFFLSMLLTLSAYMLTVTDVVTGQQRVASVLGLALIQVWVQLVFFLHLERKSRPRWNLLLFFFMVMVIVIIVGGSLWIMQNLNYNVMPHMYEN